MKVTKVIYHLQLQLAEENSRMNSIDLYLQKVRRNLASFRPLLLNDTLISLGWEMKVNIYLSCPSQKHLEVLS